MGENSNIGKNSTRGDEPILEKKPISGMVIVAINLLILFVYTLMIKLAGGIGGLILNAIILFFHVIFCLGIALDRKSRVWLLSALLVLAIGFSTCTMIGTYTIR